MRRLRLFQSSGSTDWLSPLLVVSKGLVSVGNCVPFPYVNTALSSGVALLELIQVSTLTTKDLINYSFYIEMVSNSSDDLKYLAESVVTIMQLLREEVDRHSSAQDTRFQQLCVEFTRCVKWESCSYMTPEG
jgi:hypothetical protein